MRRSSIATYNECQCGRLWTIGQGLRKCKHPGCEESGCAECLDQCSFCDGYCCPGHRLERLSTCGLRKKYHQCLGCIAVTEAEYELAESLEVIAA